MKRLTEIITEICENAFEKTGYEKKYARVMSSSRPDLCEFQCNGAMSLAGILKRRPLDIAEEIAAEIKENNSFSKVSVCAPGFINMDLSDEFISEYLEKMSEDADLGLEKTKKPKKYIIDYGGPNVAKPLHVGHLRSAIIGEALKRMGKIIGNEMIGDIHLGDWGLQMGLIIEELKDRAVKDFSIKDLEEIYPEASKKSKETDENGNLTENAAKFKKRALLSTGLLQSGDEECKKVWQRIMELSLADLKKNYERLNVDFELWKGESDVQKYIPDMLEDFIKKGIAYESEGALVVDVGDEKDQEKLPPCIVRKSDGASLYATTDLATLVEREMLYDPDGYIYVADKRQDMHYKSFFRVAKKAGIVNGEKTLEFIGFGTMNGRDGKPFKTRECGVMRLCMLMDEINDAVRRKMDGNGNKENIADGETEKIAEVVGLAAVKYGDLSNQASKDYVFDIEKFTGFEGNTGPYILYTAVRIKSIFEKFQKDGGNIPDVKKAAFETVLKENTARELALKLSGYNEVMQNAWEERMPHRICRFVYECSDAFSSFYNDVKILSEEDENKKMSSLKLLMLTERVIRSCTDVLGFGIPERM